MTDNEKTKEQLIEELKQLRTQLQHADQQSKIFQAIMDRAPLLISAVDLQGNVTLANQRCNKVENVCNKQFLGNNIHDLFPPKIAAPMWQNNMLALSTNDMVESEELITHKDKTKHVYFTVKFPLTEGNEEPFGVASISYDITELRYALELSINDKITGLYSRRYFNMRFPGELHQAQRTKHLFSLLIMEIDNLESFEQLYGEQRACDVASTIASTLQSVCCREDDLNFRLSKTQMASIFTISDFKEAQSAAEEIRTYVESLAIQHENAGKHGIITVSMGVAVINYDDKLDQENIIELTEKAMEKSKSLGGNLICLAEKPAS